MTQAAEQKPEESQVKIESFQRTLRIALTADEIASRADRAAHLVVAVEQKEDERKAANTAAKSQIEELAAELKRVSTEVRDKATYGSVDCERRFVYRTGKVVEVRRDTGAVLHERAMTLDERQLELDIDDDEAADGEEPAANDSDEDDAPESGSTDEPKAKQKKPRAKKAKG